MEEELLSDVAVHHDAATCDVLCSRTTVLVGGAAAAGCELCDREQQALNESLFLQQTHPNIAAAMPPMITSEGISTTTV